MAILHCGRCGKPFEAIDRSKRRQVYCSRECYGAALAGPRLTPKTCGNCGTSFVPDRSLRRFCSRRCMFDYRRKQRTIRCPVCGREFQRSSRAHVYCSNECRGKHYSGPANAMFNGYMAADDAGYIRYSSRHPAHPTKRVHQVVWEESGRPDICEVCGGKPGVVHHIDNNKANNAIGNLMRLCQSCHRRLHATRSRAARQIPLSLSEGV